MIRGLSVVVVLLSITPTRAEEPFEQTKMAWLNCYGEQLAVAKPGRRRHSTEALDRLLKARCGDLEDQEEREFADFVKRQIGNPLTELLAYKIIFQVEHSAHEQHRRVINDLIKIDEEERKTK